MAKFAATDYSITIAGTDFSSSLNSVELSQEADDLETTAFGSSWRTRIGGLKQASITLNFMQDFGAGSVDAAKLSKSWVNKKNPESVHSLYLNHLKSLGSSASAGAVSELPDLPDGPPIGSDDQNFLNCGF